MSYSLSYAHAALKKLNKLPREVIARIVFKLTLAKGNPFHYFEHLEERSDYKLRIGDYRVIADINQSTQKIEVTDVGHRKNIYKG